mgnify:CR=1 FL=1
MKNNTTEKRTVANPWEEGQLEAFADSLRQGERSLSTRRQYGREVRRFREWMRGRALDKEAVISYKEILEKTYRPASVNTKLAAINSFLAFLGRQEWKVKLLRIQRSAYCSGERELSRQEYQQLVMAARRKGDERLCVLLQTVCSTGIRISELSFITVEAVTAGEAVVRLKGKSRTVLLPEKLRCLLRKYLRRTGITHGAVFVTRSGAPMDRSNIWKQMKALGEEAAVPEQKVFPHNLRHLFARCFYAVGKDIAKLADVLGHSSIETTRIYLVTSGAEHQRTLDRLGLIS